MVGPESPPLKNPRCSAAFGGRFLVVTRNGKTEDTLDFPPCSASPAYSEALYTRTIFSQHYPSVLSMSAAVVYDNYVSIWRLIDDGRLDALLGNEDLPVIINEKQKGVTPLFLVRSNGVFAKKWCSGVFAVGETRRT